MGKTGKGNSKLRTIGNALIGMSVVGVLITFYPVIREEVNYRTTDVYQVKPISEAFNIRIPSIKVNLPVIENVNPWEKGEYLAALQRGVAHARGTSTPVGEGSMYLFAHSSDVPWRMTRYNTAFFRLGRVKLGDEIVITYAGKDYRYRVNDKKIVWPGEVEYLTRQDKNQLILQTCTPIGTALQRLLVFAEPMNQDSLKKMNSSLFTLNF